MENKITIVADDETIELYVLEETKINGKNYILATDAEEDEDGECMILKDMSAPGDTEAVYEFVEDDDELDSVGRIFMSLMDDETDIIL